MVLDLIRPFVAVGCVCFCLRECVCKRFWSNGVVAVRLGSVVVFACVP